MPIEWVVISGAVTEFARKYLEHRLSKYADANVKIPRQATILKKANEVFADGFSKELDSVVELPTLTQHLYQRALESFLCQQHVQFKLEETLDGWPDLDWAGLKSIWSEVTDTDGRRLIDLPAGFDWPKLAETYHKALRRCMVADPEARQVLTAGAVVRQSEFTEAIKTKVDRLGPLSRPFDLNRYGQALETAYGNLKLGILDTNGIYSDKRVRLLNIYIPQSVKQSIPPRDITRDYLLQLRDLVLCV